ncbi:serine hydrolase domain-containing protein [Demequina flava]|uniref:serine hydrolase domain-containing protein n=1 Tax=Demequina flava TaxID=1095025 RepID=UPI0013648C0D|nr:serine hydrolase domain-containing protein [Demequina flava]
MTNTQTLRALDDIALATSHRSLTSQVRFEVQMPGLQWSFLDDGAPEQYFVASITKLATTAIVFQHIDEGHYALTTPAQDLLEGSVTEGVPGFATSSPPVTVADLLGHTSGIPDYFETAPRGTDTMLARIRREDVGWTPLEAIDSVRGRDAVATPGDTSKAHYSDTNFQLLQLIIEGIDGPYATAVQQRICSPLGLTQTFVFGTEHLERFDDIAAITDGKSAFARPLAMASFQADGGMVSTTVEQIRFLRAYMGGQLFSQGLLERATTNWRRMFFPLEYSLGTMRFRLPRAMSPFSPMPPFIGHSGASGAVLFHDPSRDLTIAGSVNQLRKRSMAFQVLGKIERALR